MHGYETDDGELIVLSDAELATAAPRKTRTIDIEAFVELAEVDPIHFDHPYILMPAGESDGTLRAYRLLIDVLGATEQAALGRCVLRTKEYLVLIRVLDKRLSLTTLRFHDEVRAVKDVPVPKRKRPSKKQVDQTVALIEALSCDWDPSRYEDEYEKRLKRILRDKRKGKTVKAPKREKAPKPVDDLMAALERTLDEIQRGDRTPA